MSQTVQIVAKAKNKPNADWRVMSIHCDSESDARQQIAQSSEIMRKTFDFAVRVTTITPVEVQ